jgi:hypothetical protein
MRDEGQGKKGKREKGQGTRDKGQGTRKTKADSLLRMKYGYGQDDRECPDLNDALRRVKGGSELVALSIGQRLYASGCLGS